MTARRAIGHCTGEESTDTGMIVGIVIVWMCSFGFNSLRSGEGGGMERGVVAGDGWVKSQSFPAPNNIYNYW